MLRTLALAVMMLLGGASGYKLCFNVNKVPAEAVAKWADWAETRASLDCVFAFGSPHDTDPIEGDDAVKLVASNMTVMEINTDWTEKNGTRYNWLATNTTKLLVRTARWSSRTGVDPDVTFLWDRDNTGLTLSPSQLDALQTAFPDRGVTICVHGFGDSDAEKAQIVAAMRHPYVRGVVIESTFRSMRLRDRRIPMAAWSLAAETLQLGKQLYFMVPPVGPGFPALPVDRTYPQLWADVVHDLEFRFGRDLVQSDRFHIVPGAYCSEFCPTLVLRFFPTFGDGQWADTFFGALGMLAAAKHDLGALLPSERNPTFCDNFEGPGDYGIRTQQDPDVCAARFWPAPLP